MRNRRIFPLFIMLIVIFAPGIGPTGVQGYDRVLPSRAVVEVRPCDGDPDEPCGVEAPSPCSREPEPFADVSEASTIGTVWSLIVDVLLASGTSLR